jgi:hypothetical protein
MNARQFVNFVLGMGLPIMLAGFLFGLVTNNWTLAAGVSFGSWGAFPVALLVMRVGSAITRKG